ncbi:MAG: alpha/beta hydrolase [Clostridia bacterium]|nr:alpha/beta hydrolase [Clostridia bacterium]
MKKFSENTKYGDIVYEPLFKGYEYMIDFRRSSFSHEFENLTLKSIEDRFSWEAKKMVDSANYLYESQKNANVFYNMFPEKSVGLAAFVKEEKSRFALICPGGGYSAICAITEGYNLAKRLNKLGFSAFVLSYSVGKNATAPNPQQDIAQAVRFIISNADKFNIDVKDYIVIGFSAGAHVAGCFGTRELGYKKYSLPAPKMLVLGYPVVIMGDSMVPFENFRLLEGALQKANVEFRYEAFPYNTHGLPIGADKNDEDWILRALSFYNSL